jgi:hypothetical protein
VKSKEQVARELLLDGEDQQEEEEEDVEEDEEEDEDEENEAGADESKKRVAGEAAAGAEASAFAATAGSSVHVAGFSPQLQAAIAAVLPPTDPLDDPSFSSVAYINNLFPTEQSLADIDQAVTRVRVKVGPGP